MANKTLFNGEVLVDLGSDVFARKIVVVNADGSAIVGGVSSVFTRSGAVVAVTGDYYGVMSAPVSGSTAASRHAGATASGAPVSGTYAVGDYIIDQTGSIRICTVAGTPGTWVAPGGSIATSGTGNSVLTGNGTISGTLRLGATSGGNASTVLNIPVAPTASANYGLVSVGNGTWDGSTSGFFVGSASGTALAINMASGYGGNLLDLQTNGTSYLSVSATGTLALPGSSGNSVITGAYLHLGRGGPISLEPLNNAAYYVSASQTGAFLRVAPIALVGGSSALAFMMNNAAHTAVTTDIHEGINMPAHTFTISANTSPMSSNYFGAPTLLGSAATKTAADFYNHYIEAPVASTNAAITRPWALGLGGTLRVAAVDAVTAGGALGIMLGNLVAGIYFGSGAPSALTAPQGSLYLRTDGVGVTSRAYINTDAGTTWTAVATAG